MQDGAGVRQMVEDELRRHGRRLRDLEVAARARPPGVGAKRGAGGFGVAFISRRAVETELEAGTLAEARVEGLDLTARDLHRARGGPRRPSAAQAFVAFAREQLAVIVRWGIGELPGSSTSWGSSGRCSSRAPLGLARSPAAAPLERGARRTASPFRADVDGISPWAAGARSTRQGRLGGVGSPARLRADDVLRRGVDAFFGVRDARPQAGRRRRRRAAGRDRLRAGADARPAAGRERRYGDERARALCRGALLPASSTSPAAARPGSTAGCRACSRTATTSRRARGSLEAAGDAGEALGDARPLPRARDGAGRRRPYGLPHGAMNAICLPPAMRFNAEVVPDAGGRSGRARRGARPARRLRAAARLRRPRGRARRARRHAAAHARARSRTLGRPRRGGRRAASIRLVAGTARVRVP